MTLPWHPLLIIVILQCLQRLMIPILSLPRNTLNFVILTFGARYSLAQWRPYAGIVTPPAVLTCSLLWPQSHRHRNIVEVRMIMNISLPCSLDRSKTHLCCIFLTSAVIQSKCAFCAFWICKSSSFFFLFSTSFAIASSAAPSPAPSQQPEHLLRPSKPPPQLFGLPSPSEPLQLYKPLWPVIT